MKSSKNNNTESIYNQDIDTYIINGAEKGDENNIKKFNIKIEKDKNMKSRNMNMN